MGSVLDWGTKTQPAGQKVFLKKREKWQSCYKGAEGKTEDCF